MTNAPLVSIVMPSYNQAPFLARSIESVLTQDYANIELIVADGQSDDGSVTILKEIAQQDARLRWVSEPDTGPANAINKALSRVRGTLVGWLNSDDLYTPGAIARAVQSFTNRPDWLMCYGHGEHINAADEVLGIYPTKPPQTGLEGFQSGCYICQPTVFFKPTLTVLIGSLDETLKTSFDYDLWLRAFESVPERIGFVDEVQAQSRLHADCITQNMQRTVALEGAMLSWRYLGRGAPHWVATYLEQTRNTMPGSDFHEHARTVLNEVKPFLDPPQFQSLNQIFGN